MTEPDFQKKKFSSRKYAGKTSFLAFSRDFIISFFRFFAQRCVLAMPKIWLNWIFEKNFFWPKMPEIYRISPFLLIFIWLFPYISLFFHTKTLFITTPTIKHHAFVYKTDFCTRNFLKIAGTADFYRKNCISWFSRAVVDIFSLNFAH